MKWNLLKALLSSLFDWGSRDSADHSFQGELPSQWGASQSFGALSPLRSVSLSQWASSGLSRARAPFSLSSPLVGFFLLLLSHSGASVLAVENRYPFYFIFFITQNKMLMN